MTTLTLQTLMRQNHVDTIIITDEKAINYYTGCHFHTGERFTGLIIDQNTNQPMLIINKLFDQLPTKSLKVIYYYDHEEPMSIVSKYLIGKVVGVDKTLKALFLLKLLDMNKNITFKTAHEIDIVKAIKSEEEIVKMRRASLVNDEVMLKVRDFLKVGLTETEVENFIKETYASHEVEVSFPPIVAFGENGADPHAEPSNRKLKANESIVIDIGCKLDDYCSDMTRTYFLESNPYKVIYDAVLNANLEAIRHIKPLMKFSDIDAYARNIIEKAGYGQYFTHRLGHGIGRSVHEPFDVSGSNDMLIQKGMCFSIEPGIYIPGQVGVRIEDLVVVTDEGCEVLNHVAKDNEIRRG